MKKFLSHRLVWPIAALVALIAVNTISRPSFLSITMQNGQFYGSLIDILRNSAPLMLVALGMTLVIATRGIDLSVGAIMAVSGAVALTIIEASPDPGNLGVVMIAIAAAVGTALLLGVWNGFLVSVLGIQPIIATLVLMLAGRGVALLITKGFITTINSDPYQFMAQGYVLGLPFAFYVSIVAVIVVGVLERRTALGMLTEAVGINPEASRLAGVRSRGIIWGAYIASGTLAGMAGILYSSNIMAADANAAGLYIELDAILAVVLGGTSLAGGKFSIAGTVVGVFTIQTLKSTITFLGVPPAVSPVFMAAAVLIVVLLQSRRFRAFFQTAGRSALRPLTDVLTQRCCPDGHSHRRARFHPHRRDDLPSLPQPPHLVDPGVRRRRDPVDHDRRRDGHVPELPAAADPLLDPAGQRLPARPGGGDDLRHPHRGHRPLRRCGHGFHRHPVRQSAVAGGSGRGRGSRDDPHRGGDRSADRRTRPVLRRAAVHRLADRHVPRSGPRLRGEPPVDQGGQRGSPVAAVHAVLVRRLLHHADGDHRLITVALAAFVLRFTRFGRTVYAVGGNEQSARLMGLPVVRAKLSVYVISGVCAGLAGIVLTAYSGAGYPLNGVGTELDTIAAVVIGGTLLTGGSGFVLGSMIGVFVYGLIRTIISFSGAEQSWTRITVGVLLLIFVVVQRIIVSRSALRG